MDLRHCAVLGAVVALPFLAGCVSEDLNTGAPPRLFEPMGTYPAGAYHGVNLFFEVLPEDVPDAADWMKLEGERRLPPIIPEILPGGVEVYRVRNIHRVLFQNNMFEVGPHRYPPMRQARLYVFKERSGNFSFSFRGQGIVVLSKEPWKPSIYYYPEIEREGRQEKIKREVVKVGFATIENLTDEGKWLVNGRPYFPDPSRPLELDGAVRAPRTP
jgi:hypothetical protein